MSRLGGEYTLKGILRELVGYKSAVVGLIILAALLFISIYTVIAIPYSEAKELWKGSEPWLKNPKNAAPIWVNLFSRKKLPSTIILSNGEVYTIKERGRERVAVTYTFNYKYDDFPTEMILFVTSNRSSRVYLKLYWTKPDGDEIYLGKYRVKPSTTTPIYITNNIMLEDELNRRIIKKLGKKPEFAITVIRGLFLAYTGKLEPMKGKYTFTIVPQAKDLSGLDMELVIHGKVHGLTGTDHLRRPLSIALMWGTPIALVFGVTASTLIAFTQLAIATISGWFGGKTDFVIQRITEVYMILPFLPILLMISLFYRINIWSLLPIIVALSIFGTAVKTNRALVMEIKTYPYIEAARAYGASNLRIIFLYILPKIIPPIVPSIILSVPDYVFLEAILAFFGIGDPTLPTWGKLLHDALENGALYKGYYYWVIEPSLMLVLASVAFALIGLALDKIVNPRLREL
ncbi:MAG: ABC transporter permease [Thermoproteota archaeon]|nr:MAG: ABC transporter permease [Candidatus Korarchaeota archaeon]RLG54454.1 MAG: ABC transporter permease [Candidatus Korarchaeota archaeon]